MTAGKTVSTRTNDSPLHGVKVQKKLDEVQKDNISESFNF